MTGPITQLPIGRSDLDHLAPTHRLVPITRTLFADAETPVTVYRKLAGGRPGTFLLDSAEPGASFSRWSFVGVHSRARLTAVDGEAHWTGEVPPGVPTSGDPLAALGAAWRAVKGPRLPGLPPLTGGFVGYLGYDVVRRLERLPEKAVDDLHLPELTMFLTTDLAAVDNHECKVVLIANALLAPEMGGAELDAAYADAVLRLDRMQAALATPSVPTIATIEPAAPKEAESRTPPGQYEPAVQAALEAVRAGEVFQIQIGQRFAAQTTADPLDVYRVLRTLNPSPYMYYLRAGEPGSDVGEIDIVGCSPEALVSVHGERVVLHPIAGTRRRGVTADEDNALAGELLADPKERAEHVMLVDLARNDLGRVAAPGSVEVVQFGAVERYSHVWHIVSTVEATVAAGMDAFDVLTATFPAGTLTGAPKVRAMELIDELEPVRRHVYGGAVGYLDAAGDLDVAIAIRTAVMRGGTAYVQASAGIVADSIPANEEQETRNKARAVLQAIATAETMRTVT